MSERYRQDLHGRSCEIYASTSQQSDKQLILYSLSGRQLAFSCFTMPLPPGSSGFPLVGETLSLLFDPNFIPHRYEKHGSIFRSHIVGRPAVYMVGPEALEFVLSTGADHFSWNEGWPTSFRALLGGSLFFQDGEEHRRNRKLLMPAFHGPALTGYLDIIAQVAQAHITRWEKQGEFASFDQLKPLTFEIASQIFMGSAPGSETEELSQLFTSLTDGLFSFVNIPGTKLHRGLKARAALLNYISEKIAQRRANPQLQHLDALSLLIQAQDETGDRLSEAEIRSQTLLLLLAGHETTTALLSWMMVELARHPQVLAAARAEQDQWDAGPITLEQLGKMPLLERILLEVERLHPPVQWSFRGVVKPFEFQGYEVPAGWLVQYAILHTHMLPEIYPEPLSFNPDRWIDAKYPPYSLASFGGGARICIGIAFAKLEMRWILSYLLRNFEWELLPNQSTEPVLIPIRRPKDGGKVRLKRRH